MQVLIIGAGIGGLTCAIACRRAGLDVTLLEQSAALSEIGAGIQIPPNATRVMRYLGLLPQLQSLGIKTTYLDIRRYENGDLIFRKPMTDEYTEKFGAEWWTIHRADYHKILLDEAERCGANILLGSKVVRLDVPQTKVILEHGQVLSASVIIGADGLWSVTRNTLLDTPSPPYETGDLAYRATVTREALLALNNPHLDELCERGRVTLWAGPGMHCVLYPLRDGSALNLVLIRPDNMPTGTKTAKGHVDELIDTFQGWDPILHKMLSCLDSVLKWKLLHHEDIPQWVKNCTTVLGDACHPTLPYQGQGAAMAVEDGMLLGFLLGEFHKNVKPIVGTGDPLLISLLKLYEGMRRPRTTLNVRGAMNNRVFYHMKDGPDQRERDKLSEDFDYKNGASEYVWLDAEYQKDLLGYDVLAHGKEEFRAWCMNNEVGEFDRGSSGPKL